MLKSWLLWVLTILLTLVLLLFSDVSYALTLFILTLVLPLLLVVFNQVMARRIKVSFKLPEVAAKERQFKVTFAFLIVDICLWFPYAAILAVRIF